MQSRESGIREKNLSDEEFEAQKAQPQQLQPIESEQQEPDDEPEETDRVVHKNGNKYILRSDRDKLLDAMQQIDNKVYVNAIISLDDSKDGFFNSDVEKVIEEEILKKAGFSEQNSLTMYELDQALKLENVDDYVCYNSFYNMLISLIRGMVDEIKNKYLDKPVNTHKVRGKGKDSTGYFIKKGALDNKDAFANSIDHRRKIYLKKIKINKGSTENSSNTEQKWLYEITSKIANFKDYLTNQSGCIEKIVSIILSRHQQNKILSTNVILAEVLKTILAKDEYSALLVTDKNLASIDNQLELKQTHPEQKELIVKSHGKKRADGGINNDSVVFNAYQTAKRSLKDKIYNTIKKHTTIFTWCGATSDGPKVSKYLGLFKLANDKVASMKVEEVIAEMKNFDHSKSTSSDSNNMTGMLNQPMDWSYTEKAAADLVKKRKAIQTKTVEGESSERKIVRPNNPLITKQNQTTTQNGIAKHVQNYTKLLEIGVLLKNTRISQLFGTKSTSATLSTIQSDILDSLLKGNNLPDDIPEKDKKDFDTAKISLFEKINSIILNECNKPGGCFIRQKAAGPDDELTVTLSELGKNKLKGDKLTIRKGGFKNTAPLTNSKFTGTVSQPTQTRTVEVYSSLSSQTQMPEGQQPALVIATANPEQQPSRPVQTEATSSLNISFTMFGRTPVVKENSSQVSEAQQPIATENPEPMQEEYQEYPQSPKSRPVQTEPSVSIHVTGSIFGADKMMAVENNIIKLNQCLETRSLGTNPPLDKLLDDILAQANISMAVNKEKNLLIEMIKNKLLKLPDRKTEEDRDEDKNFYHKIMSSQTLGKLINLFSRADCKDWCNYLEPLMYKGLELFVNKPSNIK